MLIVVLITEADVVRELWKIFFLLPSEGCRRESGNYVRFGCMGCGRVIIHLLWQKLCIWISRLFTSLPLKWEEIRSEQLMSQFRPGLPQLSAGISKRATGWKPTKIKHICLYIKLKLQVSGSQSGSRYFLCEGVTTSFQGVAKSLVLPSWNVALSATIFGWGIQLLSWK